MALGPFRQDFSIAFEQIPLPTAYSTQKHYFIEAEKDVMDLAHYFENTDGTGILATCDPADRVNQAIYSKPFVLDGSTVAFVMKEKTSHQNLRHHLKASYLFIEKGAGCKGIRLHLTMQREEKNRSLVEVLREKQPCIFSKEDDSDKFLVLFEVDQVRPLIGDKLPR
jgi:hypothetical protein